MGKKALPELEISRESSVTEGKKLLISAQGEKKLQGRTAFLERIVALFIKWSRIRDDRAWVYYDRQYGGYVGCLFDVACAVNETIERISGRKVVPFRSDNALGKALQRFVDEREFWDSAPFPLAFGVEQFATPGQEQREKIEAELRAIPPHELTEQRITEIILRRHPEIIYKSRGSTKGE